MHQYKMVQIPPGITLSKAQRGNEAAAYLEGAVNEMASQGWEFMRVDAIGVEVQPGCLGALAGIKGGSTVYYVITFRRDRV